MSTNCLLSSKLVSVLFQVVSDFAKVIKVPDLHQRFFSFCAGSVPAGQSVIKIYTASSKIREGAMLQMIEAYLRTY